MTETSERLRTIRKCRHLSRAQLVRECLPRRIAERTIRRIESGEIGAPRQHTVKVLADGLRVEVGELTGDLPFPEYVRSGSMEVGTFPIGGEFRPDLRLAFDVIRHRYGWNEQRVIALAPLMFVLLVERCIGWQEQRLADLNEQLERFDRQISSRIKAVANQDSALKDIPAGGDQPLPEHFHRRFGEYLCALAAELPKGTAEPMVTDLWSGPQGRICEAYLDRLTGNPNTSDISRNARWALEYGDVRLDDIPEKLRSDAAKGERARWLASRLSDRTKAMLQERSARGLPIGPRSIGRWKAVEPGQEREDSHTPVAENTGLPGQDGA